MANDNNIHHDDIKELEEVMLNTDGTLKFNSFRLIEIVDVGYILVRKNIFSRKFSISLFDKKKFNKAISEKKTEIKNVKVKVVDLTNAELNQQIENVSLRVNDANLDESIKNRDIVLLKILKQERQYRNDPSYDRHPIVLQSTVMVKRVVEKEYENASVNLSAQFTGLKFRWFWHKAIMIPLRNTILDTRKIVADVRNNEGKGETVEIDVNYRFTIVDPVKFLNKIGGENKNPIRPIIAQCGKKLDGGVRLYATQFGVDKINTEEDDLHTKMQSVFLEIENEYGLKFSILEKVVNRDEDYQKMEKDIELSRQKKKIAQNEADAERIKNQPEIEKYEQINAIDAKKPAIEYVSMVGAIKGNSKMTDEEAHSRLNQVNRSKTVTQDITIGGIPMSSQQTIEPQRQLLNNYTAEDIQYFTNLGICTQNGYLSVEDSEALCTSRGITFDGLVFHIGSLDFFEINNLIESKKNNNSKSKVL